MEYVIGILLGFITLNFLLKIGFYNSFSGILAAGVGCSLFVMAIWPWATEQSKTQIADFLSSPERMQDAAVMITLESAVMIAFCFDCFAGFRRHDTFFKRGLTRLLKIYPGMLITVVLAYSLTQLIFAYPGISFRTVAWLFAGATGIGIIGIGWFLRKYLADESLRLELLFVTNLFILLMGIIAMENGRTSYQSVSNVNMQATIITLGIFVAGAIIGFIWKFIKRHRI